MSRLNFVWFFTNSSGWMSKMAPTPKICCFSLQVCSFGFTFYIVLYICCNFLKPLTKEQLIITHQCKCLSLMFKMCLLLFECELTCICNFLYAWWIKKEKKTTNSLLYYHFHAELSVQAMTVDRLKYKMMEPPFYIEDGQSKKISNDQELIQSEPICCPQNQKGNN